MTIQPIPSPLNATSDAEGNISFVYPQVPVSQDFTGTLSVPGAPDFAVFSATTGASSIGQWSGANSYGPIRVAAGYQLTITGSGLIPNTSYVSQFQGYASTSEETPIVFPNAYEDVVNVISDQVLLLQGVATTSSFTVTIPLSSKWRSVLVVGNFGSALVTPTGVESGIEYNTWTPPYFFSDTIVSLRIPIIAGVDNNLSIAFTGVTLEGPYWILADTANVDAAIYPESMLQVQVLQDPSYPLDVVEYGGLLTKSIVTSDTSLHSLLAAPGSGQAYRLHSANLTLGASGSFMKISISGSQPFCTIAAGGSGFVNLGGRLITSAISVQNTNASSAGLEVGYDIVTTPNIS